MDAVIVVLLLALLEVCGTRHDNSTNAEADQYNNGANAKTDLYIVTMLSYPLDLEGSVHPVWKARWEDGPNIAPAIHLAVEQINNRTDLLANYTLHVIESDGGCNVGVRTYTSFVKTFYSSTSPHWSHVVGIVGPTCPESAHAIALLNSKSSNPTVLLHTGVDFSLKQHPYTFGIVASATLYAEMVLQLIVYTRWSKVALLHSETNNDLNRVYRDFQSKATGHPEVNVDLSLPVSMTYLPLDVVSDSEVRIIIAFTGPHLTLQLLCLAYHEHVTFPSYQWVLVDWLPDSIIETEFHHQDKTYHCSAAMIEEAVNGSLALFWDLEVDSEMVTVSGQTYSQYEHDYSANVATTVWANLLYDATWALALALSASDVAFDRPNSFEVTSNLVEQLRHLNFTGVSGQVSFDNETGFNTQRTLKLSQFSNGSSLTVGHYSNATGFVAYAIPAIISSEFETEVVEVAPSGPVLGLCIIFTVSIPLLLTVTTHVVSVIYHRYRPIVASSYKLNQFAYVGCYILVAEILLYAVRGLITLDTETLDALCTTAIWSEGIGLSLILGTVCVKCWRLYKIYTTAEACKPVIRHKFLLRDSTLAVGVLILLLPEVAVQVVRTAFDRPQWREITRTVSDSSHTMEVSFGCIDKQHTDIYWYAFEIGYKTLLTLYTFWLAHNSRQLEEKGFDMKHVINFVYVWTFATICVIPPVVYIYTRRTAAEIAFAAFIVAAVYNTTIVYSCTALLFLPPVIELFKGKWKGDFSERSFWSTKPCTL